MAAGTKGRVLFLMNYMMEHTDDNRAITTDELIHIYEENGYKANRHTIADDISVLNDAGIEIISERRGNGKAYHIGARLFELPELKMLVDAVSSCRFITAAKSDTLIEKLSKLTNAENRKVLTTKVYTSDRVKTSNPRVFQNTDTICQTIDQRKKVSFHYWDYSPEKEKILRHDGYLYIVSPYALIWNDDRYYLAAFSDKHLKIATFRVDRMCDVNVLQDDAVVDESFNPAEYANRTMKMYDGDEVDQEITIRCENQYMQNVIDRFGEEIHTEIADENHFLATVTVKPSHTFFSWVFQFCGGISIENPRDVRDAYIGMIWDALKNQ